MGFRSDIYICLKNEDYKELIAGNKSTQKP